MLINLFHFLWFLLLLGAGLLVPGWLLGRALGTPAGGPGALLGSAALLLNILLLLDVAGITITAFHLGTVLAVLCMGLILVARQRPDASTEASTPRPVWRWQPWHWLLVPAGLGFLAIVVRVGWQPLSGWDCYVRWDFLARQIVRTGSLGFYPAVTADDFRYYGWCDGIAPLVSGLYVWSYFSLGRMEFWATSPVVLAQAMLVFYLVWRLAETRGGPAAGAAAVALVAISPALLWAVAMGQETGLTALCTLAMFWFIERGRGDARSGWMIWAGLAAGTGALAREYALALIPLGLLALAWWHRPRRDWVRFTVTAIVIALPWYMRNWVKTGNPLYCLKIGNLFPTNPVYMDWLRRVAEVYRIGAHPAETIPTLGLLLGLMAGGALGLGLVFGFVRLRSHGPWLAALVAFAALWLWSIAYTAGGHNYTLRVLSPAVALGTVMGGIGLARVAAGQRAWFLAAVLSVLAVDAGERSLYLPSNSRPNWWRQDFLAWRQFEDVVAIKYASPSWTAVADAADRRSILVTNVASFRVLSDVGAHPITIYSPAVRFLFDASTGLKAGSERLRTAGYRFVLIVRSQIDDPVLFAHPFFTELVNTTPVWSYSQSHLYDLYPVEQRRTNPPALSPAR